VTTAPLNGRRICHDVTVCQSSYIGTLIIGEQKYVSTLASASHESLGDDLVETPQFHRRSNFYSKYLRLRFGSHLSCFTILNAGCHGWSLGSFRAYASSISWRTLPWSLTERRGFCVGETIHRDRSMVDPHLYFNLLGRIAHLFDVSSAVVYNIAGVGLQSCCGWAVHRLCADHSQWWRRI